MNPDNAEKLEKEQEVQNKGAAQSVPQKRSYKPREKKELTIAALNEQINKKKQQQESIQADIDDLTAKRNTLFVAESELLGLMDVLADPERAAWLAKKVDESNMKRN